MNNQETLTQDELISLAKVYAGSTISFFVLYEAIYYIYEKCSANRNLDPERVCLLEYKRWNPQKKADFVSRITSQIHAFVAICIAFKALFYTW